MKPFRCSACARRRGDKSRPVAVAYALICEMSHDNDVDFAAAMSEPQWAQLTSGAERMLAAGCAFSESDVSAIAAGDHDEARATFGSIDGYEDVDRVLTWVFDGEEP